MNVEPIIKSRLQRFRESFDLENSRDGIVFEKFVNHAILSGHQPDAFGSDSELLDQICVGGSDDMGIDGIAIKLNGLLIKNIQEAADVIERFQRITLEFIFIQSKMRPEFDSGEFLKFTAGVRDFISENHTQPKNDLIINALKIKDYLLSDDVVVMWDSNPAIRLYYVAMGKWRESIHLNAHADQFKSDASKNTTYDECNVHFIDADGLKTICDNNENKFKISIETIDTMPLTEVDGVKNSCITLCYASELIKLLSTDEGVIRKSLFDDNVRDYQGLNNVNDEISQTIESNPNIFGLLNNGITIVCDEYTPSNRRITLMNPQIVNGCQTSHVLYYANQKGHTIKDVPVQIKIISTNDLDITNQIVRGTNRQNIVYDEAFETTKLFHKDLEEFFGAIGTEYQKVYYERRSKQFNHDPRIKQTDKVNLKILTQYMIACFLNQPHMSHRHEAKLLPEFGSRIFLGHQSKLPYYTVSLLFINADRLFRSEELKDKKLQTYRPHILMVFREMLCGSVPSLNNEKKIDVYCKKLLDCIIDPNCLKVNLMKAVDVFQESTTYWTKNLKRSYDGRKDIQEFTNILLDKCTSEVRKKERPAIQEEYSYGEVVNVINDRNGDKCGFIRRPNGDVFFHSKQNTQLDFNGIKGISVSYKLTNNVKTGKPLALDVKRIEKNN